MKASALLLAASLAWIGAPAQASTVYRCTVNGVKTFVDSPRACPDGRAEGATPPQVAAPPALPDRAGAATSPDVRSCAKLRDDAPRLRQCLREQRRLEVRALTTPRLQLVSRNLVEFLQTPSREPGVIAIARDGRPASWCESFFADLAALRNVDVVDDDELPGPAWSKPSATQAPWRSPIVHEEFQEYAHALGGVASGYVTVRWKGGGPIAVRVRPACTDGNGRAACNSVRISGVDVHDSEVPAACAAMFIGQAYWASWQDSQTPIRVRLR